MGYTSIILYNIYRCAYNMRVLLVKNKINLNRTLFYIILCGRKTATRIRENIVVGTIGKYFFRAI